MSVRKHFSRRFLAGAAAVPLVAAALVMSTPGMAEAGTCGQNWTNRDPTGGTGKFDGTHYTIPIHTGIYSDCRTAYLVDVSKKLWYHCFRMNDYGNTWTHVRIDGTDWAGWVWDGNLDDNGSYYAC